MESLKQALAFPLYLTALWLLWVLGRQLDSDAVSLVILGGIFIVFANWMHQRKYLLSRVVIIAAGIAVIFIAWNNNHTPTTNTQASMTKAARDNNWQVYSEELLTELRRQGKPVFINVTADWCITCLANERLVFTDDTLSFMRDNNIHLIKGNWTNYNPAITQLLKNYGRSGIPLYLLFPTNARARVLPQILTPTMFRNAIEDIGSL
jgi:thiol:disulfide interchange protein DsbD